MFLSSLFSSNIFFLFGILLKLIDDHEDGLINIMSQNTCLLLKCIFIIVTLIAFTIDVKFVDDYMYVVLSMAFIENSLVKKYFFYSIRYLTMILKKNLGLLVKKEIWKSPSVCFDINQLTLQFY